MDNLEGHINDRLEKSKSAFSVTKIVFVILGIILLAEFIYAIRVLTSPTPPPPPKTVSIQKSAAKISLNASNTNFQVKDSVPVSIILDTGSRKVDGVDVIVRFDPKILEASSGGIVKGKIFNEYPVASLDTKAGLVSISGVSSLANNFQGVDQFAMINFKAKAPGKTSLMVVFAKGSTTDSNIVETDTSKDILEAVDNLELDIR